MRRMGLVISAAAVLGAATAGSVGAVAQSFPETIPLPNGWLPEGIAVAPGGSFYAGSRANGAVYGGLLRTGEGAVVVPGTPGRVAVGIDEDRGRLFVAGGPGGSAFVYDAGTGEQIAAYSFAASPTFVNDVIVTRTAAWFTDSLQPFLYRVPLGPDGGPEPAHEAVPLSGDIAFQAGFNVNGIDATPNGKTLVIVQSNTGKLFRVDPDTGTTDEIELTGGDVTAGDGILLDGKTLYVVQNQLNQIAVVELDPDLGAGAIVGTIVDPDFDIPTTIDEHGSRLYAVNARFTTPPTPDTPYSIVQVRKPSG